ncbi:MAG: helix-turn-helix domain-containing protein [Chthoniobacterales bacterium]
MQNTAVLQEEPIAHNDRKLIDALRRSKIYRQYEKVFSQSTGLPLALRPVESFDLPFHGKKNENPFCAFLADRKGACAFCLQTQERLVKQQGGQARSLRCPFGLTETRVPVQLGDRLIGYLRVGQVFTQAPKASAFKATIRSLFPTGLAEEKKATELWKQTPVIPLEKYEAAVQLLTFFARQLSALSNQILIEEENAEPAVITRAREYIAANKTAPLSLSTVAKAAGASVFHFCKIFHRSTGLNFTNYVARTRVEDARAGLRNPNRRVSEIAYDVGFQSLTQFNRTFKRIFAESPSEYREKIFNRGALPA